MSVDTNTCASTKVCPQCSTTFARPKHTAQRKWERRKHCSRACADQSMRREIALGSKVCQQCSKPFSTFRRVGTKSWEERKFCSKPCAAKGMRRSGPKVKRTHCKSGKHPLTGKHLRIDLNGRRSCRTCAQARWRERHQKQRDQMNAERRARRVRQKQRSSTTTRSRPRTKPQPRPAPAAAPQRPVWRPAGFSPVPNTKRPA